MKNFLTNKRILLLILLLAAFFRLTGINWDRGQHLHPDERFLTMVETAIKIPQSFKDYLNPKISPMNPYNNGYGFFVYGTFPLNLTKIIGEISNYRDYSNIHFVGRILSALFDLGVVFLLYKIAAKIFNEKVGLLSAFLYSIMVLPIQLSHFFAVDTFLNFFLILSFYLLTLLITNHQSLITNSALGFSFGLAIACKISALYFAPIIGLGFLFVFIKSLKEKKILLFFICSFLFAITSLLVFRFAQPQAFADGNFLNWKINPQFVGNLNELKSYGNPDSWFPPGIQWKKTLPIIFPLKNLILWGLGLPLGVISVMAVVYSLVILVRFISKEKLSRWSSLTFSLSLIIFWVLGLFFYQGIQFSKTMRYFLPIYPFLALLSANLLIQIEIFLRKIFPKKIVVINILFLFFYLISLVYPLSFMSIYTHPITRVSASEWIYKNVPSGSKIINEEWDDGLPLGLAFFPPVAYKHDQIFMYDFDTPEKWQKINGKLQMADYIFLSSNRAYGSTMKLPEKYPQTIKYYQSLFNSTGKFKMVAEFTSRPCFPPIGKPLFCFNDDNAEEAFTVYDHPKVLIFKK